MTRRAYHLAKPEQHSSAVDFTSDSSSSLLSSGEEFVPDIVAKRVRREGRASQVVKRALQDFGLEETEKIVRKAKSRRTSIDQDPMVSFIQEESEFVDAGRHTGHNSQFTAGNYLTCFLYRSQ